RSSSFSSLQIREQRRVPLLLGEGAGAVFSFFHDEFVERRVDGQGIVAGKTGETKLIQRSAGSAHHAFDIEVTKAVDTEIFRDLFPGHLVGDEFLRVWQIVAVVAGIPVTG